jgi:hypothetical protein
VARAREPRDGDGQVVASLLHPREARLRHLPADAVAAARFLDRQGGEVAGVAPGEVRHRYLAERHVVLERGDRLRDGHRHELAVLLAAEDDRLGIVQDPAQAAGGESALAKRAHQEGERFSEGRVVDPLDHQHARSSSSLRASQEPRRVS